MIQKNENIQRALGKILLCPKGQAEKVMAHKGCSENSGETEE